MRETARPLKRAGDHRNRINRSGAGVHSKKFRRFIFGSLWIFLIAVPANEPAHAEQNWYVTGYYARLTDADLADCLGGNFSWEDAHLVAFGLGRRLITVWNHLNFELEGQVGKYFGDQDHLEFNLLLIARWLTFPWNDYLKTTLAVGNGVSYATDIPEIEAENHAKTARLLDYLMFELTFGLPQYPQWDLITRVHHRSGAYGLFDGVHGASNALALGLRYHF